MRMLKLVIHIEVLKTTEIVRNQHECADNFIGVFVCDF